MGVEGNFYICHTENVDRCEIFMREKKKKKFCLVYQRKYKQNNNWGKEIKLLGTNG